VKILGRLALDEERVRPNLQDGVHREHVGFHDVLERSDKRPVARELFVPPTVQCGERGADEHLVYGCVQLHPWKSLGESARVRGEEFWKIRVLKIAEPVRHPEMAEVNNRNNFGAPQLGERFICERPIVATWPQPGPMKRRPIAQKTNPQFLQQLEIRAPHLIVATFLHLVDTVLPVLNRRNAILDSGGEHECGNRFHNGKSTRRGNEAALCIDSLQRTPGRRKRSGFALGQAPYTPWGKGLFGRVCTAQSPANEFICLSSRARRSRAW
jgi:hypothetical protein